MEAKQLTDKFIKAAKPKEKRYLIRATNNNAGGLHLRVEPALDGFRDDPRYLDLVTRIGLPELH